MSYSQNDFREVAWNGISFSVPGDWHPYSIEPLYLALEDQHGPVLELKWQNVQGVRARQAHSRDLWGWYARRLGKLATAVPLPEEFAAALKGYVVSGYTLGGPGGGLLGVLVYCPECHRVSLIQFHRVATRAEREIHRAVLASYRDHRSDGLTTWAMYDIRAVAPQALALSEHRFTAGEFKLSLAAKRMDLHLYRWGPAAVILRHRSLGEFAADHSGCRPDQFGIVDSDQENVVEGQFSGRSRRRSGGLGHWFSGGGYRKLRYWTVTDKNRILAVEMTGQGLPDHDLFRLVCKSYEAV